MTDSLAYRQMGTAARGQAHTLFAQTMAYVAATAALFALGAWLGRDLNGVVGIIAFIAGFGARPATPPGATWPRSHACFSGRWWP